MGTQKKRLYSIDVLRGLAIIFMAIDHTRDYFGPTTVDVYNVNEVGFGLFITRWITNFCAPAFIFLSGVSIFLMAQKQSPKELSKFLLKRGLWLVFLEVFVISFFWQFEFYNYILLQVMWAIGISMICMAGLIHLPKKLLLALSIVILFTHNLLDAYDISLTKSFNLWPLIHYHYKYIFTSGFKIIVSYPFLPWLAVMILGFLIGKWYKIQQELRLRYFFMLSFGCMCLFIILRLCTHFGDPNVFVFNSSSYLISFMSFINVMKYPPSLQFLLINFSFIFFGLAILEKIKIKDSNVLLCFGSVPMFFYLLHIPLVHLSAIIYSHLYYHHAANWFHFGHLTLSKAPPSYHLNLLVVYAAWLFILILLYPACLWFRKFKQTHSHPLLHYF